MGVRTAAADQVASVAAAHPGQAPALLRRLARALAAPDWDARVAGAACIGMIAAGTAHPTVDEVAAGVEGAAADASPSSSSPLSLAGFDPARILAGGKHLLASGGTEFDEPFEPGLPPRERAARQRAALARRLGLDAAGGRLFDASDLIKDEDLMAGVEGGGGAAAVNAGGGVDAATLAAEMTGLSARERAQAKRAAKKAAASGGGDRPTKKARAGADALPPASADAAAVADAAAGGWPLAALSDALLTSVLGPAWEARHGAALGLLEIMRTHARRAGVRGPPRPGYVPPPGSPDLPTAAALATDAAADNEAWVEGAALRLLCVLALDRFGDYVGDAATAPVREAAAQALGAALARAAPGVAAAGARAAAALAAAPGAPWEAVHGGLLGLKYILAARVAATGAGGGGSDDDNASLLDIALPPALASLADPAASEDVRGAAAGALAPVAGALAARAGDARAVAAAAWAALPSLDDLSPAAAPLTDLLASLIAHGCPLPPGVAPGGAAGALLPLVGHALARVRAAACRCLAALAAAPGAGAWLANADVLAPALRAAFQGVASGGAGDARAAEAAGAAWHALLAAAPPSALAAAATPDLTSTWLDLAATPAGEEPADGLLFAPAPRGAPRAARPAAAAARGWRPPPPDADGDDAVADAVIEGALAGAGALGELGAAVGGDAGGAAALASACEGGTLSSRATSRLVAGAALLYWCRLADGQGGAGRPPPRALAACLAALAAPPPPYDEAGPARARAAAAGADYARSAPKGVAPADAPPAAARAAADLAAAAAAAAASEAAHHAACSGALAAAAIAMGGLPPKLNTVLQPLMACLRREARARLRVLAAAALADAAGLAADCDPCPNGKVVAAIVGMATSDPSTCPSPDAEDEAPAAPPPPARLGGEAALAAFADRFGGDLWTALPLLEATALEPLEGGGGGGDPARRVAALCVVRALAPAAARAGFAARAAAAVAAAIGDAAPGVRTAAAAAGAALAAAAPGAALAPLLRAAAAALRPAAPDAARAGGVRLAAALVVRGNADLAPAAALLAVPLMRAAADPLPAVRAAAAAALASTVALLPLAAGHADPPPWADADQAAAWRADAPLLAGLVDGRAAPPAPLPPALAAALRPYQRDGVSWLAFLRTLGLHGVLADDMGLGKTLQTGAAIAAAAADAAATGAPAKPSLVVCPTTLVGHWEAEVRKHAPLAALTVLRYEGLPAVRAKLRGAVSPKPGSKAASSPPPSIVVMSYDTLRADAAWVSGVRWRYAVLDEGHAIRNPHSRLAAAARGVVAEHRLILSGTPIQNDVREMWALFDWLMPGFLGAERAFSSRYGKALDAARTSKKQLAAAAEALLSVADLHAQVMPFVLRRTKGAVLTELPPKTVLDVVVDPSPLQDALLAAASASGGGAAAAAALAAAGDGSAGRAAAAGAFRALAYARKLCTSPAMVLDEGSGPSADAVAAAAASLGVKPTPAAVRAAVAKEPTRHAPKMAALTDLLAGCGIIQAGDGEGGGSGDGPDAGSGGHRALIFAQLRATLDLVESSVLRPSGVPFLRLDGGVPAADRFGVAAAFEADPTVPVLLLTTHVGGLGLNLTAADTVIFVEHDWNPMKDLQAMDRAHRLGQTRPVTVYRLLTRGTLEERVMSLQRFKVDVAGAVVNADNVSLTSMDASRLLDSLAAGGGARGGAPGSSASEPAGDAAAAAAAAAAGGGAGLKAALASLGDLWDEAQGAEQYDVDAFVAKLGGGGGGGKG